MHILFLVFKLGLRHFLGIFIELGCVCVLFVKFLLELLQTLILALRRLLKAFLISLWELLRLGQVWGPNSREAARRLHWVWAACIICLLYYTLPSNTIFL